MKLISFCVGKNDYFGVAVKNGIIDLTSIVFDGRKFLDLSDAISADGGLSSIRIAVQEADGVDFSFDEITYKLPIPRPKKFFV